MQFACCLGFVIVIIMHILDACWKINEENKNKWFFQISQSKSILDMTFKEKSLKFIEHYQKELSPRKPAYCKCKYSPSCSEYARQAIEKHGAYKGWTLSIWRLLRCNPFSKGGNDPVK